MDAGLIIRCRLHCFLCSPRNGVVVEEWGVGKPNSLDGAVCIPEWFFFASKIRMLGSRMVIFELGWNPEFAEELLPTRPHVDDGCLLFVVCSFCQTHRAA